mmetsp:Transcript_1106/g.2074  ORF Transcript_1106/g.2074 Transcript_1106/m.2074 type:complete len:174 (-) Transcript_1106:266-787(-)|eukprot:CAMPEP_0167791106 /NCGR_PEP_ID=MMETSP0111_2-20121227/11725_1 /TAXON_ID=91324 /ORGANISM="Lotharella globosa, Strain CCCM811" /LENGTH=173 /DNA_ID=CAMNT_0007683685 /DNA_START=34 /DNA_END=555 /DNA_ORIENTATION=+
MYRRVATLANRRILARASPKWEYLTSKFGAEVNEFRSNMEQMEAVIGKAPKKITPIDFAAWESKVGKEAVAAVKDQWENQWLKGKKAETMVTFDEAEAKKMKDECAALVAAAQDFEDTNRLRLREIEMSIAILQNEIDNIDDLEVEDLAKRYPKIAERAEEEVKEGVWAGGRD